MKSLSKTIAIVVIMLLASLSSNSAWYDLSNLTKKSCKDVPFVVSDYGYTQSFKNKLKEEILQEQRKTSKGAIGKTKFIDEHTGVSTKLERVGKNGKVVTNAELDHLVPLKHFHDSGGCHASKADKIKFGTDRDNLRLTSTHNNRVKGAKTPAGWTPGSSTDEKLRHLDDWAKVANKHGYVSSFGMTRFVTKNPNAVKWTKTGAKVTGGIAAAVFIGPLAAAPFMVDGIIDAGTEVMIISEDPDAYWLGVVSNYENATDSVVDWSSNSWTSSKGWSSDAWESSSNWSENSWDSTKGWSSNTWNTAKDWSSDGVDSTKDWSTDAWNVTKDWSSDAKDEVKEWYSNISE